MPNVANAHKVQLKMLNMHPVEYTYMYRHNGNPVRNFKILLYINLNRPFPHSKKQWCQIETRVEKTCQSEYDNVHRNLVVVLLFEYIGLLFNLMNLYCKYTLYIYYCVTDQSQNPVAIMIWHFIILFLLYYLSCGHLQLKTK